MKWITMPLIAVAGLMLLLPSLFHGAYGYAGGIAALSIAAALVLWRFPQSRASDLLLVIESATVAASALVGLHTLFAVIALTLYLFAWNAGHRYGHLDRATVDPQAKASFAAGTLLRSILPAVVVGLVVSAFLFVRMPMSFGRGLGISLSVLLLIAVFVGVARTTRKDEER
jgi:hypothetical protein